MTIQFNFQCLRKTIACSELFSTVNDIKLNSERWITPCQLKIQLSHTQILENRE